MGDTTVAGATAGCGPAVGQANATAGLVRWAAGAGEQSAAGGGCGGPVTAGRADLFHDPLWQLLEDCVEYTL